MPDLGWTCRCLPRAWRLRVVSWWAGRRERVYAAVAANPRETAWGIARRAGMLRWETDRHLAALRAAGRLTARWGPLLISVLYEITPTDPGRQ